MENTEDIILTLKKLAKKEHNVKLRQRYDVIRLFLQGHHKKEIDTGTGSYFVQDYF